MAFGADVASELLDRETVRALGAHSVDTVTLVVLVRRGSNLVIHQEECRPAARGSVLSHYGVNPNRPLRSPRHAFAWMDGRGVLQVGGTSEVGKAYLRRMYHAMVVDGGDLELF
jgi:hypothetical protein